MILWNVYFSGRWRHKTKVLHFRKSPACLADSGIAPQHYQFFTTSPPCPQPNVKYFLRPNRGLLSGNWKSIRMFLKFGLCLHVTWNWFLKVLFEVENVIANNVELHGDARAVLSWKNCQLENSGTRNSRVDPNSPQVIQTCVRFMPFEGVCTWRRENF